MAGPDSPIFLVGMPRSGTTAIFEALATHPQVGWFSFGVERLPSLPAVAWLSRPSRWHLALRKSVRPSSSGRSWFEKLREGPSEAYSAWARLCGERFVYDYMLGERCPPAVRSEVRDYVRKVLGHQGRRRFVAKLTGPARMEYLHSIFEDARFVHVVRDGRNVVQSLLRVDFWRDTWRMTEPAWSGGLTDRDLEEWKREGGSPGVLAALQWKRVIERTREEASRVRPRGYMEVRYEDFLREPVRTIEEIWRACELPPSALTVRFIRERLKPESLSGRPPVLSHDEWRSLTRIVGDLLAELGYSP